MDATPELGATTYNSQLGRKWAVALALAGSAACSAFLINDIDTVAENAQRFAIEVSDGSVRAYEVITKKESISLRVPALDPEIEAGYKDASVSVHLDMKSDSGLLGSVCRGIHIGGGNVLTGAHCVHEAVDNDSENFSVFGADGKDKRKGVEVEHGTKRFIVSEERFFARYDGRSYDYDVNYDVSLIRSPDLNNTFLSLADSEPAAGDAVYMTQRLEGDSATTFGGRIIRGANEQSPLISILYLLDDTNKNACIPGTSGSAVINKDGKVIGIHVAANESKKITGKLAEIYNLSKAEIGKTAVTCTAVPTNTAALLLALPALAATER